MRPDLLVVGGGTAGLRAALEASNRGARVVLAAPGTLGGTCLNTGCIPTKAMLHAAELVRTVETLPEFGLKGEVTVDVGALMDRVRGIVAEGHRHVVRSVARHDRLTVVRANARFLDRERVKVGGKVFRPKKVLLATGSSPVVPPVEGLREAGFLTNVEAVALDSMPESLIIIGGGYISVEFATFFASLGCAVTIIERNPRLLKYVDAEVAAVVEESLKRLGVTVLAEKQVTKVSVVRGEKRVSFRSGSRAAYIAAQELLVATGRRPNTHGLGLEDAGVRLSERGAVEVDASLRTANRNVYAVGDCNGRAMFAHAAKREVAVALENILGRGGARMEFHLVPWAVFTDPPVAGVGVLPDGAEVLSADFSHVGRAAVMGDTRGLVKAAFVKGRLIGAVMAGPRCDDLIHEFAALLAANATRAQFERIIHVHPTLSEVFGNLRE